MKDRLKAVRQALGLKQREIASRLGVSTGSVGGWESGGDVPGAARIYQFCKEFNVNEEWLRTGKGDMFVKPQTESDADVTMRYIVECYKGFPPELQEKVLDLCRRILDQARAGVATDEIIKHVSIGDNNQNINIKQ